MDSRKMVAGILTGLAAGAVVSFFLYSGKNRRFGRRLIKKGNNLGEDLKERFSEFIDGLENKFHRILK